MEVTKLLEEVKARYESADSIEIDVNTGELAIIVTPRDGYPEYILKYFEHYSELMDLPPNEDIWE